MQVFDFDNTIYHGESTFDFAMFIIRRKKSLLKYAPGIMRLLIKYKRCKMNAVEFQNELEKFTGPFLQNKEFIKKSVQDFWQKNRKKLNPNMLAKIKKEDVILTCSPSFLIKEIESDLNTPNIVATEIDIEKGKIYFLNFGKNKVKVFQEKFPKKKIQTVYTDSYNDKALMDVAKNAFLVKKGKCIKIK